MWPDNPVAAVWGTMVGKKVVMAVTGMVLVGFVIAHMLGNLKMFLGPATIDAYAAFLRTMGEPLVPYSLLLWVVPDVSTRTRRRPSSAGSAPLRWPFR